MAKRKARPALDDNQPDRAAAVRLTVSANRLALSDRRLAAGAPGHVRLPPQPRQSRGISFEL